MTPLKITRQITDRSERSIDQYFTELSKIRMISAAEEAELARRIRKGDEDALQELTVSNLRFVVSVAKQYQNQGLPLSDLISEGNIGLMHAASKFDETRGFKFISYAVWWIRQSIAAALTSKARIVRLPQNKVSALGKMNKGINKLEQQLERLPTNMEIGTELDMTEEEVISIQSSAHRCLGLAQPLQANGESSGLMSDILEDVDAIQPNSFLLQEDLRDDIQRCLDDLTEREALIVKLSFGLDGVQPLSNAELGEALDLTAERVRQIRRTALHSLEKSRRKHILVKHLA